MIYVLSVGIAAPQVNVLKRMFAIHVHDVYGTLYSYMIVNPTIKQKVQILFICLVEKAV